MLNQIILTMSKYLQNFSKAKLDNRPLEYNGISGIQIEVESCAHFIES